MRWTCGLGDKKVVSLSPGKCDSSLFPEQHLPGLLSKVLFLYTNVVGKTESYKEHLYNHL